MKMTVTTVEPQGFRRYHVGNQPMTREVRVATVKWPDGIEESLPVVWKQVLTQTPGHLGKVGVDVPYVEVNYHGTTILVDMGGLDIVQVG